MSNTRFPGVTALGDRKYLIRFEVRHTKTGKMVERKRVIKDCPSAAEANARRAQMMHEVAGAEAPRDRLRVSTCLDTWIAHKKPELAPSTLDRYVRTLVNHFVPHFGDYYLDAVSFADLVRWRNEQSGQATTINSRLRIVKTFFADATATYNLPRDPAARIEALPEFGHSEEAPNSLTPEQLHELLEAVKRHAPQWLALFAVLAFTGARVGEATALRWEDLTADEVMIRRSHWRGRIRHTTKTNRWRKLPVPSALAAILADHRRALSAAFEFEQSDALRERARRRLESGWVFPSTKGTPTLPSVVRNALLTVVDRVEREAAKDGRESPLPSFTVHGLRRTMNNLLRQLTDDAVVQRAILGHATERMSEHYSTVRMDEKREAVGRVIQLVRRPGAKPEVLPEGEDARSETGA